MKKIFLALILICITGVSLFAWEPGDLAKFPSCMDGKSWILDLGVGFWDAGPINIGDVYIPQLRLTVDKNVGLGEAKLPFFIGGLVSYAGRSYSYSSNHYFNHNISVGGRFGYHFNWGLKNFDTYLVSTAGWIIYAGDRYNSYGVGEVLLGVNLGARYFISNWFGFWVEVGFSTTLSLLDVGVTFKF
jgi:hypothetical protein